VIVPDKTKWKALPLFFINFFYKIRSYHAVVVSQDFVGNVPPEANLPEILQSRVQFNILENLELF